VLEKDVNLAIAERTRELLVQELGVEVVMTREDDHLLSLTRRTEIANEAGGDLFVSIHCNSWFSSEAGGFEAYFLSPARTDRDRAVALAENKADEFSGGSGDVRSDIDFILWDMVQSEFLNESSHFAELTQKAMGDRLGIRDRGVKQANFTVLQGARMPAVLIETAFLSNPQEESLLVDEDFQQRVAEGLVEAVKRLQERYR
jgi:N-acetylmuramoyl-L-alanine amidase